MTGGPVPVGCRVLGHRLRFRADGPTMRWECERGCGTADGAKAYPTAEDAQRYATAFDRRGDDRLGDRAPLGLLPLRIWRKLSRHRARDVS
ncbi:hypothetical protein PZ938_16190 [Luteipulveratus sp. YIM 133132]|uniref:hypothetical protein n=1 Tax=Luteipulveratus flavus TaxID=3031728 RepID=UPI0023AE79B5|nr:hypothetical protein [Luteipulveratus sp. YIM 133132]MDE9367159.1 hypothetical protein [Luteipulveratus sp. YIM 133132]